jgi:hypothetical protein
MNNANMNCYSCTTDLKLFNTHVLSVSNEVFLLLVLISGGARWMSKIMQENGKVCIFLTGAKPIKLFLNTVVHFTQKNGMWTEDQELAMLVSATFALFEIHARKNADRCLAKLQLSLCTDSRL